MNFLFSFTSSGPLDIKEFLINIVAPIEWNSTFESICKIKLTLSSQSGSNFKIPNKPIFKRVSLKLNCKIDQYLRKQPKYFLDP